MNTITLPRETVQQALDALEEGFELVEKEYESDWRHGLPSREKQLRAIKSQVDAHEQVIAALRAALQQDEPQSFPTCQGMNCGCTDGRSHSLESPKHKER